MSRQLLYLDNASTSFPKTEAMRKCLASFYDTPIGSYGRSRDNWTISKSIAIEELRDFLSDLIGGRGGEHIIFTQNATDAINRVVLGLPKLRREEALISVMEHNAVTRPLHALEGKEVRRFPSLQDGSIDLEKLPQYLSSSPAPRLIIINVMSNVNGVIQPIREVSQIIRKLTPTSLILLDASQALPYTTIQASEWGIDYVAITGHKGLLGPTGTGALYVGTPHLLTPTIRGGNGYRSEEQTEIQHMPDRYEAGTINMIGLLSWYESLKELPTPHITPQKWNEYISLLRTISPDLSILCALSPLQQGPLISLYPHKVSPSRLSDELYERFQILTRSGVHCTPLAHQHLKTLPHGTIRISPSAYTTWDDLITLYRALDKLLNQ